MPTEHKIRRLSLEEFKATAAPHGAEALLGRFNGGRFMECHQRIFAETGIWIQELVPVFQKLDAVLTLGKLPTELQ